MSLFAIIEVEDGLTVAELAPHEEPEDAATIHGGVVIDPGPYQSYEEAYQAMLALEDEIEDNPSE